MATTLSCQRLIKRVYSRQDGSLLVAKVGLVIVILVLVTAVSILRLSDCVLRGSQVAAFVGRMVIHVAYDAFSPFIIWVSVVAVSVIARFFIARFLSACICGCIVIALSLLPTRRAVSLVVAVSWIGLPLFADAHNELFFSS